MVFLFLLFFLFISFLLPITFLNEIVRARDETRDFSAISRNGYFVCHFVCHFVRHFVRYPASIYSR